jgi:HK97 family phage portal protein
MTNFFSKLFSKSKPVAERKFYDSYLTNGVYGYNGTSTTVTPQEAANYYTQVAPLFTAVDMISTSVATITLAINNPTADELVYNHPLLDLIERPNAQCSGTEFFIQLSNFYLLMGNVFVIATGPVNRPPLELQIVNPMSVNLKEGTDGYLDTITVNTSANSSRVFSRKEVNGHFRYFDGAETEIWHIKTYSPRIYAGQLMGMSPLNPISLELDQYLESSTHNLSLLKRGARPSGALKFSEMLTDDQFNRYQQQVDSFYSGSKNAGRLLLLENADFQEMSQSNKDMDFATLKSSITNTIFTAFRIPLPLVNAEFSTYDNMKSSVLNFYDNAVLPLLDKLLSEMTAFLMFRYDKKELLTLSYDPESLEALEPRRVDKVQALQSSGVLTLNELRFVMGYEPLSGGDVVYIPSTMMPIDSDPNAQAEVDKLLKNNRFVY